MSLVGGLQRDPDTEVTHLLQSQGWPWSASFKGRQEPQRLTSCRAEVVFGQRASKETKDNSDLHALDPIVLQVSGLGRVPGTAATHFLQRHVWARSADLNSEGWQLLTIWPWHSTVRLAGPDTLSKNALTNCRVGDIDYEEGRTVIAKSKITNTCPDLWKRKKTCLNDIGHFFIIKALKVNDTSISGESVPFVNASSRKLTA